MLLEKDAKNKLDWKENKFYLKDNTRKTNINRYYKEKMVNGRAYFKMVTNYRV